MCANTVDFIKKNDKNAEMMEFWPFLKKTEYGRLQKCIRYVHKFKKISPSFYAYTYVQKYAIMSDETCDSTFV